MTHERPATMGRSTLHEPLDAALERGVVLLNELDGIRYLTYPALDELSGIRALTTLREDGPTQEAHIYPDEWLARFVPWLQRALGVPGAAVVAGRQVHGQAHVVVDARNVPRPNGMRRFDHTDALMTSLPAVGLVVLTADCVPIFLADPVVRTVALVHAGKGGTQCRITSKVAAAFFETTGATPANTTALIGPSIGDGCYPVRLWDENVRQLRAVGVERIVAPALCTRCNLDRFYSYRVEKGCTGRMVSAIILADA